MRRRLASASLLACTAAVAGAAGLQGACSSTGISGTIDAGGPAHDASSSSSSSSGSSSSGGSSSGTGDATGSSSGAGYGPPTQCAAMPGQVPQPNCTTYPPGQQSCMSPPLACPTTPCNASSSCLALSDNSGQSVEAFRVRKLQLVAPPALAKPFVQKAVLDQSVNLHGLCGEQGDGTLDIVMQLDTTSGALTFGSGNMSSDPVAAGYCFAAGTVDGMSVAPVTLATTRNPDGSLSTTKAPEVMLPVFPPAGSGLPLGLAFPIRELQLQEMSVTGNGNCIGSYNPDAITSVSGNICTDDITACARWTTAGALTGFITLEDADAVVVPQLSETLCVLLTGGTSVTIGPNGEKSCARANGQIQAKGDYCSSPAGPGGCGDSYWFAATFAASAAKVSPPGMPCLVSSDASTD